MKVVIDTNIIINVFLSPILTSASFRIIEYCLMGKIKPQMSAALYAEVLDVSGRGYIGSNSSYTANEIEQILNAYFKVSNWVNISFLWRPNLKDEADNHLVELAVASGSKYIISHNIKDLTSGDLIFDFEVVTPEKFLKEVI